MITDAQAIFFDMDGTILDWQTQTGMEESWRDACIAGCDSVAGIAPDALHAAIRARRHWFWEDPERARTGRMNLTGSSRTVVAHALTDLGHDAPELAMRIADDYRLRRDVLIAPYVGAIETLDAIRARGIPMALITNGNAQAQRQSVERFGLDRYFDCIVIEGEFGCGKPDERVFRHALAATGAAPANAWMVGDNFEADIVTPHRLGMHTAWVDEAGAGLPPDASVQPHRVIRSVSELVR